MGRRIANHNPSDYQPYVGRSAVAHKGGVHGAAVAKVERSYQHVDPTAVGNVGRLVVSELGGRANTPIRAEQLGHQLEGVIDPRCSRRSSSSSRPRASPSRAPRPRFELLIRRHATDYMAPFKVLDYTCLVEQRDGRELLAEATVKVEVDGEVLHTAADGNGPVNALDAALRKALSAFYPSIDDVHLVDYKVRILDGDAATAARTRVVIDSADGARTWSTMGSDTNIIAASAHALADSLEYAIWKSGGELRRRDERHFTTAGAPSPTRPPTVKAERARHHRDAPEVAGCPNQPRRRPFRRSISVAGPSPRAAAPRVAARSSSPRATTMGRVGGGQRRESTRSTAPWTRHSPRS